MKLVYAIWFVVLYGWEVIYSTLRLAQLVLSPRLSLTPCFVEVPLDLKGEMPRFLFACLISMTPGSMSVGLDPDREVLQVHLLDAPDEAAAIDEIKTVFEKPLIRIFGSGGNP